MGINKLFDIANRSLLTYQSALNATSNNISNANNPEYSRQRVVLTAEDPEYNGKLAFGSGVKLTDIQRIRDGILDEQTWSYNSRQSYAEKQYGTLSKLEALLSEPTDLGLSNLTAQFFNSFEKLAVDPSSTALRNNTLNAAQNMTGKLTNIYSGYTEIQQDIKQETIQMVKTVNSYVDQVYTLNKQIYQVTANGSTPSDLLDKRDFLIGELSKIANINVTINSDQSATISIGGVFAVDRLNSQQFQMTETVDGISVTTDDGAAKLSLNYGELYSNLNVYNKEIPKYQANLDAIGQAIFDNVNAIHNTGQTNTDPPQTNIDFFSSYGQGKLVVNQNIIDNSNLIAASANGEGGNNEIAQQIADLQSTSLIGTETISNSYSNFVNNLANEIQLQNQNQESFQLVLNQLDNQITEKSGVSVDEEMVNVIKFQRSYDAAARMIRVADEMFQTLLNTI